jgi:hypothetical protein
VFLTSAQIGGDLDCAAGTFISRSSAPALFANGVKVGGSVNLCKSFKAEGRVDFANAKIGTNLDCDRGEFVVKCDEIALIADSAKIGGSAYFRGTNIIGNVFLGFATIDDNFQWLNIESREKAGLDLRFTKARMLLNAENSWPNPGRLNVEGFVYEQIDSEVSSRNRAPLDFSRSHTSSWQRLSEKWVSKMTSAKY